MNGNLISLANLVVLVSIGAGGAVAWDRLNTRLDTVEEAVLIGTLDRWKGADMEVLTQLTQETFDRLLALKPEDRVSIVLPNPILVIRAREGREAEARQKRRELLKE